MTTQKQPWTLTMFDRGDGWHVLALQRGKDWNSGRILFYVTFASGAALRDGEQPRFYWSDNSTPEVVGENENTSIHLTDTSRMLECQLLLAEKMAECARGVYDER